MKRRRSIAEILGDAEAPPPKPRPKQVKDHRQALVLEQARLARIRADKLSGDLVERSAVLDYWGSIVADIRAALLAMPSRIGARLSLSPEVVADLDSEV